MRLSLRLTPRFHSPGPAPIGGSLLQVERAQRRAELRVEPAVDGEAARARVVVDPARRDLLPRVQQPAEFVVDLENQVDAVTLQIAAMPDNLVEVSNG